jgi:hypothetical protein
MRDASGSLRRRPTATSIASRKIAQARRPVPERDPHQRPGVVADCAFSDDGKLYVGSNLFDAGSVYRVDGWHDPNTAKVTPSARRHRALETFAVRGATSHRMSDTGPPRA